jgi:DNA/RNA-binding domain of Phe-tRNA-synthetase-like protein
MPLEALTEAGDKLIEGLQQMMPGAEIESMLIGPEAR